MSVPLFSRSLQKISNYVLEYLFSISHGERDAASGGEGVFGGVVLYPTRLASLTASPDDVVVAVLGRQDQARHSAVLVLNVALVQEQPDDVHVSLSASVLEGAETGLVRYVATNEDEAKARSEATS